MKLRFMDGRLQYLQHPRRGNRWVDVPHETSHYDEPVSPTNLPVMEPKPDERIAEVIVRHCGCDPKGENERMWCDKHIIVTFLIGLFTGMGIGFLFWC